jgi:glycosyltransferase involved in cell wall biosynthesis
MRPEKQIARLLRAFALLSRNLNARLVVVGDGPEKPHLKLLTRQLGLCGRVQFTWQVADPAALYRTFDIFALTSDTEQMPYTVLEAMASGCAIAATDVGDVKRLVAEENAPLVVGRDD